MSATESSNNSSQRINESSHQSNLGDSSTAAGVSKELSGQPTLSSIAATSVQSTIADTVSNTTIAPQQVAQIVQAAAFQQHPTAMHKTSSTTGTVPLS